jgi:hypothetical protein
MLSFYVLPLKLFIIQTLTCNLCFELFLSHDQGSCLYITMMIQWGMNEQRRQVYQDMTLCQQYLHGFGYLTSWADSFPGPQAPNPGNVNSNAYLVDLL